MIYQDNIVFIFEIKGWINHTIDDKNFILHKLNVCYF